MGSETSNRYFLVYKPYNMVSQFLSSHTVRLLGDLDFTFPEGTHAIGRLDNHSEGLLILTTNKKLTRLLFQGETLHRRTYMVQVNYKVSDEALQRLRTGIVFQVKGGKDYLSTPCEANIIENPPNLYKAGYQLSRNLPYTWLLITLTEGKFHQVRKMISGIRHRVQRLIRVSIEDLLLGDLQPGEVKEVEENYLFEKLKIKR
ncbi:MAG: pseudouridine synthase [Chitinophagaceae bacterium]